MNISLIEEAGILSSYRNWTNFMISLNIFFPNGGKKKKNPTLCLKQFPSHENIVRKSALNWKTCFNSYALIYQTLFFS